MEVSVKDGSVIVEDIPEISFSVSALSMKFEMLVQALAETVDWLLNQNTKAFIEEFQSVIRSSVADLVKGLNNLKIE